MCGAKIYSNVCDETAIVDKVGVHNHQQCENLSRQVVSNSIKRKAIEDPTEKPAKLIHRELKENTFSDDIDTRDIECMRRNAYIAQNFR